MPAALVPTLVAVGDSDLASVGAALPVAGEDGRASTRVHASVARVIPCPRLSDAGNCPPEIDSDTLELIVDAPDGVRRCHGDDDDDGPAPARDGLALRGREPASPDDMRARAPFSISANRGSGTTKTTGLRGDHITLASLTFSSTEVPLKYR